ERTEQFIRDKNVGGPDAEKLRFESAAAAYREFAKDRKKFEEQFREDQFKQASEILSLEQSINDAYRVRMGLGKETVADQVQIAELLKTAAGEGPSGFGVGLSKKEQAEVTKDLIDRQQKLIELTTQPGGEIAAAGKILELKKQSLGIAEKIGDLRFELSRQIYQAESEYQDKLYEQRKKQFDEIHSTTQGLLHTLFTNPRSFGGQLGSTLRDATLRPVENAL